MTFIISLIALAIERFFDWNHLRFWNWFSRYQRFLSGRVGQLPKVLLFLLSILPPVIVIAAINYFLSGLLYNIPKTIFGVVVLIYSLGPKNLWAQIYTCISALHSAEPQKALEHVKATFDLTAVDHPQEFHQGFTRAIFIAANERIFAVIFWFILLGPAAAFLYRLLGITTMQSSTGVNKIASQVKDMANWLPIRVFTFIFALGGHFTNVMKSWKHFIIASPASNDAMLGECGIAALDVDDIENIPENGVTEKQALELLDRVFVMSIVLLALVVLIS